MRWKWPLPALVLAMAALLPAAAARADFIVAPDVVVYCEPTLRPVLAGIAAAWRHDTGVPVHLLTSPTAAMLEQIGHRARADLIIGESDAAAAAAAERRLIKPETRASLWRNRLVVAQAKSAPAPSGDAAERIGDGPIAIVDPPIGSAGSDSRRALAALGLWPALERRTIGTIDTADASFLLAEGRVQRAVLYASDLAAAPGLAAAASLPDTAYPPIVYWLAQTANALSARTADFAAFLRQPPAAERARAAGLEVLP
ncbi:MAG TPA: substrate-binding domain-containing protein [Stellaceae bacterium]|nr:substrate-binding domain-containing protein [Stellaceae bacterium]